MANGFTKRQLVHQLDFSKEEADLILDYQKSLPILIENEGIDGFCINAKDLWNQLDQPYGKFYDWSKKKFKAYNFEENLDYISLTTTVVKPQGGRPENNYMLTLDMAKVLSMVDKTKNGQKARKYFLLMEDAVQRMSKWTLVRNPLKKGYVEMDKALDEYMLKTIQKNADEWDYRLEADALNVIATGFKAQDIRIYVGCKDNKTRDSLTVIYNEYLLKLQEWNTMFLRMGMNRYERYKLLYDYFNAMFPNPVPLKNVSKSIIEKNKLKLLDDVKAKVIVT